ncbi:hypothetical protein, partial [Streptomyces albidoflavus]|uniref:hypothetical protein n=1 Tax=Streptomyces albidoflavus TaxID=1886 RepID=UPI003F4DEFFD
SAPDSGDGERAEVVAATGEASERAEAEGRPAPGASTAPPRAAGPVRRWCVMTARGLRWIPVCAVAALWCVALTRAALEIGGAAAGVAAVVAGGWGLSVLPVHCVPKSRADEQAARARAAARRLVARVRGGQGEPGDG